MKLDLRNVTLLGVDCVNLLRLQLAADISSRDISYGAVKLLTSIKSDDERVIEILPITSAQQYSEFIIKELYKYIDTEFVLIFQYDGFVLNPAAWQDEFLRYDYIGAPWYHLRNLRVGNGGFSLRSKKLISWLGHNYKNFNVPIHPEDIYISMYARASLEESGMVFAPESIASRFSFEGGERTVVWNGQFGFHGLNYTDISAWLMNHPEYQDTLSFQHDTYTELMKEYPVYDGTVHTLRFENKDIEQFSELFRGVKKYEARLSYGAQHDVRSVKVGDTLILQRPRILKPNQTAVPDFKRIVVHIERFSSFAELRSAHKNMQVTIHSQDIEAWNASFDLIFGDAHYPKKLEYSVFWFT